MDFSELRGKSASGLWKDMISSQAQNEKNDIRGDNLSALLILFQLTGLRIQLPSRGSHHGKRTLPYHNVHFVCESLTPRYKVCC